MQAAASITHGDPLAAVIPGVTGILAWMTKLAGLATIIGVFAAIVLMLLVTTLAAPPWLRFALLRQRYPQHSA